MRRVVCLRAVCVVLAALSLGGCLGVMNVVTPEARYVYGGTRIDVAVIRGEAGLLGAIYFPFAFVDLPFSLVLDTVTLPVTVVTAVNRKELANPMEGWRCRRRPVPPGRTEMT